MYNIAYKLTDDYPLSQRIPDSSQFEMPTFI